MKPKRANGPKKRKTGSKAKTSALLFGSRQFKLTRTESLRFLSDNDSAPNQALIDAAISNSDIIS